MFKGLIKNESLPYVGASVSVGSGILNHFNITSTDISFIVGIVVALGTFFMNWYYKAKEDRRSEQLFKKQIKEQDHDEQN